MLKTGWVEALRFQPIFVFGYFRERGMLEHFLSAFALMLFFEGVMPFLSPEMWRNMMARAARVEDSKLRLIGLGSMLASVILLYLIHG